MKQAHYDLYRMVEETLAFEYVIGNVFHAGPNFRERERVYAATLFSHCVKGEFLSFRENGRKLTLASGETMIVPAGVRHGSAIVVSPGVLCYAHVNWRALGTLDLTRFFDLPEKVDGEASRRLLDILSALTETRNENSPWRRAAKRKALGFQLLLEVLALSRPKPGALERLQQTRRLAGALEQMETDRAGVAPDIAKLAKSVRLSPSRFRHLFKELMGEAPQAYARRLRARRAQGLLLDTELSVGEIAERVGYADPFHFSRAFKAAFGVSPTAFRAGFRASFSER